MSCTNHPAVIENIQTCARCNLPFCSNCLVIFQGKHLCGPCKNERIRALQSGRPEGELVLATVGRRLGALWIDGMIVGVPLYALMFAFIGTRAFGPNAEVAGSTGTNWAIAKVKIETPTRTKHRPARRRRMKRDIGEFFVVDRK